VLRTRSPVYSPLRAFSLDLHVLGTPPAFVLSQDQTLQLSIGAFFPSASSPDLAARRGQAVHSKHCEFRNPSSSTCYPVFRDRPGTPFPLRTSDDLASPPSPTPRRGARFLPLPTAPRQEPCCRSLCRPLNHRGPPRSSGAALSSNAGLLLSTSGVSHLRRPNRSRFALIPGFSAGPRDPPGSPPRARSLPGRRRRDPGRR
jgi:hypothetical protein